MDPKYVSSSRPINRRTAAKQLLQTQQLNPVVQERLAAIKMRSRFGAPLAEQLRSAVSAAKPTPLSAWLVFGGVIFTISAVGLFLAWLQDSWLFGAAGLLGVTLSVAVILVGHRERVQHDQPHVAQALFDEDALHTFDNVLEKLASEIPETVAVELMELKQQIKRIAQLASQAFVDESFTLEDRMYLTESVRRYLPDTLQSYLIVPRDQRSTQIVEQGQTADALLLDQLKLLRGELAKREGKLAKSSAEALLRQQRFLESKRR